MKGIGKTTAIKQNGAGNKKKKNPWHSYDLDFLFFFKMQNNKASGMSCRQKPFSIRHFANRSQNKSQII